MLGRTRRLEAMPASSVTCAVYIARNAVPLDLGDSRSLAYSHLGD